MLGLFYSVGKENELVSFHIFITYKNNDQHSALMTKPAHMQRAFSFLYESSHQTFCSSTVTLTNTSTSYTLKQRQINI